MQNPFAESQKLIRCTVRNEQSIKSERYIPLESFRLWTYQMSHKHGMEVEDVYLCL